MMFKLTKEQLRKLEDNFQLCKFEAEEGECECDKPTGIRAWFDRTDPEVIEGDYYCDKCGIEKIEKDEDFYNNFDAELYKCFVDVFCPKDNKCNLIEDCIKKWKRDGEIIR